MRSTRRATCIAIAGFALALLAGGAPAQTRSGSPDAGVTYDAGSKVLSINVTDRPLVDVLLEVQRQAGLAVVVHGQSHGTITANFDRVPIEPAIRRLLDGRSFVLTGAGHGEALRVWLVTTGDASAGHVQVRAPTRRTGSATPPAQARARAARSDDELRNLLEQSEVGTEQIEQILEQFEDSPELVEELREALIDQAAQGGLSNLQDLLQSTTKP